MKHHKPKKTVFLDVAPILPERLAAQSMLDNGMGWKMYPYFIQFANFYAVWGSAWPSVATRMFRTLTATMWMYWPMGKNFDQEKDMPRKVKDEDYWKLYPYYQVLFKGERMLEWDDAIPTLFIYGTKKWAKFHTEAFLDIVKKMEGNHVVAMDTDHWPQWEKPEEVAKEIEKFLREESSISNENMDAKKETNSINNVDQYF